MKESSPSRITDLSETQFLYIWKCYKLSHDPKLLDRLVQAYRPLAAAAVRNHTDRLPDGMEAEDLYGYAILGLLEAVEHYDPRGNPNFEAYANRWIQGGILAGIHLFRGTHRGQKADCWYPRVLRLQDPDSDLVRDLPDPEDRIGKADDRITRGRLRMLLEAEIDRLPRRQRSIIRRHYFAGEPLRAIARDLGVSHTWISYQHRIALQTLRERAYEDPVLRQEENSMIL